MLRFIVLLYCLTNVSLLFAQIKTPQEYRKAYAESYSKALQFVLNKKKDIQANLNIQPPSRTMILAAAFPELVRYSEVQNFIETSSLEMLYVRLGTNYANFSVGRFQMKPSFLEDLEIYAKNRNWTAFASLYTFESSEANQQRKIRVKRLKDLEWQLRYLNCFAFIVWQRFPQLVQKTEEEQVRFLAAAYNRGFRQSFDEITRWTNIAAFPYGEAYRQAPQFRYTDIAWDFYQKEGQKYLSP